MIGTKLPTLKKGTILMVVALSAIGLVAARWTAPIPTGTSNVISLSPVQSPAENPGLPEAFRTPSSLLSIPKLSKPDQAIKARVIKDYGKLPLWFEANQGQTDGQVKFLSRGSGYTLFLTSTEAVLALRKQSAISFQHSAKARNLDPKPETQNPELETVVRMKHVGANPTPQVVGSEELPGKVNYFISNDPKKWRTNIPTYAKVRYQNVYPGVDLVYYGNQEHLEYDFVVAPGADPGTIRLAFEGADKVEIDSNGDLVVEIAGGDLRLRKPFIYQEIAGSRQEIIGNYVLVPSPDKAREKGKDGYQIGFQLAAYDTSKPLIIDPALVYFITIDPTDTGSNGQGITLDAAGNVYVVGATHSPDFPTVNPLQPDLRGPQDAYIAKLDPAGALVYATYLGGSYIEIGFGIAVDASGNIYVTGETRSTDFPTTPDAFQPDCVIGPVFGSSNRCVDAFMAKLSPDGASLVYSTYLGGGRFDRAYRIGVDPSGNAYVMGTTESPDFPTANALQPAYGGAGGELGPGDYFVTKFGPAGSLVYSTYLGGSGQDRADPPGMAVDASGNVYVTGSTNSSDFPTTTPGAFRACERFDSFVIKLNPDGSVAYATCLGHVGGTNDIVVDALGNAYVTGTNGADAFVAKLNPTGSDLVYLNHFGGSALDWGLGIAVDLAGNAYVTGRTDSTDFPTVNPLQPIFGGNIDAFVAKLNSDGSGLVYSTYFGGPGIEQGNAIAVDPAGNAYVTGWVVPSATSSLQVGVVSVASVQAAAALSPGRFVMKIAEVPPDLIVSSLSAPTYSGAGLSISVKDTTKDVGGGSGSASTTKFFLSKNNKLDSDDVPLCSRNIPALWAGASSSGSTPCEIPANTATGTYYIIAKANANDALLETNNGNNTKYKLIKIGPDLRVTALSAPSAATVGSTISVKDTTKNVGGGSAGASTTKFFLSKNNSLGSTDVFLDSRSVPSLAPGQAKSGTTSVTIPPGTAPGTYYIIAKADGGNVVSELIESNNTKSKSITVSP
ncbi:MAG: SBBP repeat-containing protein [Deltaproteobacteria bacterium]|nr:SBBP repeat-containing protein [Deltaproteobacteria bacterium]